MNPIRRLLRHALLGAALLVAVAKAEEAVPSARDLAAQLSNKIQDGSSVLRLKMEIGKPGGGGKTVLQIQVKSQRTKSSTELVYQILWPKDRKGESFLLRKAGGRAPGGSLFTPPGSMLPLTAAKMQDGVFGSELAYDDLVENFFAWGNQAIVGTEVVDRVPCQILESKPGKGDATGYSKVRSWIDTKRMVTLRVEKFTGSGKLAKRIDTTRVSKDDAGNSTGSSFSLQRPGQDSVTEIEGSNIKHGMTFTAGDFTPEALRTLK
ncbi:MAG: outer membrane lipoprotein-sorting protein [Verrucomicrobia bacterium]|nr:outer membrane lipoprotein-sorting protein [Verrucomicrobiota bacterium]